MTIKEYLRGVEAAKMVPAASGEMSFADAMKEATEIWSNDACMGYFLRTAQIAELDQDTTRMVMGAYRAAFDEISVDEAADVYCKY